MGLRLCIAFYILKNIILLKKKATFCGKKVRIRGPVKLQIDKNAKLFIGDNFILTSGLMINSLGRNIKSCIRADSGAVIKIGNNVGMSNISIWAKASIEIGDYVKLGAD